MSGPGEKQPAGRWSGRPARGLGRLRREAVREPWGQAPTQSAEARMNFLQFHVHCLAFITVSLSIMDGSEIGLEGLPLPTVSVVVY